MCPHDILTVKGYALEDYWGEEWERRYLDCAADPRIQKRTVTVKRGGPPGAQKRGGNRHPFAFNRDTVNRLNPNGHAGVIYCSNLCTEIAQNMSPIETVSTEAQNPPGRHGGGHHHPPRRFCGVQPGQPFAGAPAGGRRPRPAEVVRTAVRALDNVIDLNFYPLPYAQLTNRRYRSIGLGVSGYHHLLAKARRAVGERRAPRPGRPGVRVHQPGRHCRQLRTGRRKGPYSLFAGSDWATGAYFEKRGYQSPEWQALAAQVRQNGMRNAYLLAVAPHQQHQHPGRHHRRHRPGDEQVLPGRKKGSMLPRVAPELSPATYWYYKTPIRSTRPGACAPPPCASATSTRPKA